MRPVIDAEGRHVGWDGTRSEVMDRIMSRRSTTTEGFPAPTHVHHIPLHRTDSTWFKGTKEYVWATDEEVRELFSDCRSPDRHPGPMPFGLVLFLDHFRT